MDFLGGAYDAAKKAVSTGFKVAENVKKNIDNGEYGKIFTSPVERFGLDKYKNTQIQFSDKENDFIQRAKNLSGVQQAKDIG
jgi:hypothetical protein